MSPRQGYRRWSLEPEGADCVGLRLYSDWGYRSDARSVAQQNTLSPVNDFFPLDSAKTYNASDKIPVHAKVHRCAQDESSHRAASQASSERAKRRIRRHPREHTIQ